MKKMGEAKGRVIGAVTKLEPLAKGARVGATTSKHQANRLNSLAQDSTTARNSQDFTQHNVAAGGFSSHIAATAFHQARFIGGSGSSIDTKELKNYLNVTPE